MALFGRFPRQPIELRQHDQNACVTCMVGQVLYVFGLTDHPDLGQIDREMGRRPGQPLATEDRGYLLQKGFCLREITSFEFETFLRDGLAYMRERRGADWTSEHEAAYSPAHVAYQQQLVRERLAQGRKYPEQLTLVSRNPTLEDVLEMLQQGWAVDVTAAGSGVVGHAALLVPHRDHPDGSLAWAYWPSQSHDTVHLWGREALTEWIRYTSSTITGIRL